VKKSILISALTVFAFIALAPVVAVITDSLIHNGRLSLESYRSILADDRQIELFINSLVLSGGTALFSLIIGVPSGFLLSRTDLYFRKYLLWLCLIPLIIPPYIHAITWIYLLGTKGRINMMIGNLFSLNDFFFNSYNIYGMKGAILVLTLSYFPVITILTISGLSAMNRELEEAGTIISSDFYVLRKITLPLILPNIIGGTILVLIFSVLNYGVPSLLRLNTYPVEIFARFSAFYDAKGAVALTLPLMLMTFILTGFQYYCMKDRPYITVGSDTKTPRPFNLGYGKIPAAGFLIVVILLSAVFPIVTLIIESGSLKAYQVAFKTAYPQIVASFVLSATAASLTVMLAFFLSYTSEKSDWKGRHLIDFFSFIPFAVPGAILGIGLIRIWNRPAADFIYESSGIVIFAYIARFSPFAVKAISANLRQIHPHLEEAAALSGVSWIKQILKIVMPLTAPGMTAGWIITFIFCMGELSATLLVIPPGETTLSVRIYTVMHYGAGNLVACLCLMLIVITLIPIFFLRYVSYSRK
jgi:iron(III) transport system permease protein